MTVSDVKAARAVEALRAGVPNRDAVAELGTDQILVQNRFIEALASVDSERREQRQLPGLLVVGDFGQGKSHLLEWLQHLALAQHFACSKVVISKETPLGDLHKVFRAAMDALSLPGQTGGLDEVAHRLDFTAPAYTALARRVQESDSGVDPLLKATLFVFERESKSNPDLKDKVVRFCKVEKIGIRDVKHAMQQLHQPVQQVKARKVKDLALPRFRFIAELLRGAGYAGWVLLLDEVELVANYSRLARAKSYATLGTLMGLVPGYEVPGMLSVGSITPELPTEVFDRRGDRESVPLLLGPKLGDLLPAAEAGMDLIAPDRRWLRIVPSTDSLRPTYDKIRELYRRAYGWESPDGGLESMEGSRRMREYVRSWITKWDLLRLDPDYQPDIEMEQVKPNLEEITALERATEDDDDEEEG